ncbi:hypothetical protein SAMN05216436_11210 [bacterium A37T11]|nr:hypothetical protein SAMN05216436_11210 [bacterium A37T11]
MEHTGHYIPDDVLSLLNDGDPTVAGTGGLGQPKRGGPNV